MLQHPIVRTCLRFLKAWHVFWPDMHTMWCLQCGPIHGVSKIKIIVEIQHSSVILLIEPPLVPSTLCCFAKYASKLTSPTFTFVNEPQMETLFASKHCSCTSNWSPWTSNTCFRTASRPILNAYCP